MQAQAETPQYLVWQEGNTEQCALWHALNQAKLPSRIVVVDDSTNADTAFRLACEGVGLLWRGDYQNGRQLLQAIQRRADKRKTKPSDTLVAAFHQYRMGQAQRARILGALLLQYGPQFSLNLRRAPEVASACREAYLDGSAGAQQAEKEGFIAPMRELQGVVGAHEWRKNGIAIAALDAKIHPHYGVFSPVRGEYCELVANTALPAGCQTALDIGTGTGVLAAILAKRGINKIIASDSETRAIACAQDNFAQLGINKQVQLLQTDLFPPHKADLLVCNPPWLPGKPGSNLEHAIYDQDSRMLRGFLHGAKEHLTSKGQAWLILSDLAEHIGLRSREQLLGWIAESGLRVLARIDIQPQHSRVNDASDVLHAARSKEVTSLWQLAAQ